LLWEDKVVWLCKRLLINLLVLQLGVVLLLVVALLLLVEEIGAPETWWLLVRCEDLMRTVVLHSKG
jgi:hypothetical protein